MIHEIILKYGVNLRFLRNLLQKKLIFLVNFLTYKKLKQMFAYFNVTCYNLVTVVILRWVLYMKPLGKSQQKIYDYIAKCSQEGHVPSVRELCQATGLKSTSTVHLHLKNLEERGLIEREPGLNRCIKLAGSEPTTRVPVLGRVTAGAPILAVEDIQGYIPINESISRGRNLFALAVVGESMINAGILDGDIVIVHKTSTASNGEIVVALIEDEATVKRFYKENGHFRLQPENETFEPIIVDNVTILGKVISLVRNY